MILKRFLMLSFIATLFTSCASKVAMDKASFYKNNKVGVVFVQDSIGIFKGGAQGLLDIAVSSGRKYKEPIKHIGKNFDPKENLRPIIENAFIQNKKDFVFINEIVDVKKLEKFNPTTKSDSETTKFFKYDLRPLKNKFQVEELMIVKITYGLSIDYYGMVEIGKSFITTINTEIIDLRNNQIIFRDPYYNIIPFKGKWKQPPHYENMSEHMKKSIDKAVEEYAKKF